MKASYILKSNAIFDGIQDEPYAGCVVVTGNKIEGIIDASQIDAYAGPRTKVIDCGDRMIMPGFIDSHMHAGGNMDYIDEDYCVDVSAAATFPEVMQILQEYGKTHPDNKFLLGVNFNFFTLTDGVYPHARLMDEYISDRMVVIHTWDCHTYFTNSKGIEFVGIKAEDPDPNKACGRYEDGSLTGEFNDTAGFIMSKKIARTFEERKGAFGNYMHKLNACDITSFADMYPSGNADTYPLFKSMEDQLTTRVHFYPSLMDTTLEEAETYKQVYNSKKLQFSGLKCLMDGVLTMHTAWMLEPYTNNPETAGYPALDKEEVRRKILEACKAGYNVRVHTIGDAAVRYLLDVFEEAEKLYGRLERRHNMEHIEYIHPDDIPRFEKLGVVANMHLRHCIFYVDNAVDYLGPEREKYCFNWRSIWDTGAIMGTGSDFPVVDFNPMLAIHAGVTRTQDDGHPEGGWLPEQCLTLAETLKMYTIGSAYAINREKELGTLESGKLADIVVLDRNLFDVPTKEILDCVPVLTMMDGEIVYEA